MISKAAMPDISIVPLAPWLGRAGIPDDLDHVFFEASAKQDFASDQERAEFRERWLGRYLGDDARHGLAAISEERSMRPKLIGYVVGSVENPATSKRFVDIPYFKEFAQLCARYPAHLHINLDAAHRSGGIGGRLIEAFCAQVQSDASKPMGVHVVTSATSRNLGFYNRHGFLERARCSCPSLAVRKTNNAQIAIHENVFLGRDF